MEGKGVQLSTSATLRLLSGFRAKEIEEHEQQEQEEDEHEQEEHEQEEDE